MTISFPEEVFVAGTDTDVGKTLVAAVLTAGLEAEYWKPIQCGLDEITDRQWVLENTELPADRFHPESYALQHPLSPHAAARLDGVEIDLEHILLPHTSRGRKLIVEGAGGLLVPLDGRHFMIDLMEKLGLPVILVARSTLGTINHTLLSLRELERSGLDVLGVVLNGPDNPVNREAIEEFGKVPILAEISPLADINPRTLRETFKQRFL